MRNTCTRLAAAGTLLLAGATANAALINEFRPNPGGADPATQTIELLGTAGESFSGVLLSIDSDSNVGTVDRLSIVTGTFDANGLLTVDIDDLENPSFTFVLTSMDATASIGDDLDLDGDGMLDSIASLGTIMDAINVPDATADFDNNSYADQLGGTSFAFIGNEPQLMFRDAVTLDWYAVAGGSDPGTFDAAGNLVDPSIFDLDPTVDTFGAVNPAAVVPVPGALWLFGSALAALAIRRRA